MGKIRKAVIPAAGLGTRLLPATKSVPKEMMPIVDKPAIQLIVEECVEAGMRVMRINFSHVSDEEVSLRLSSLAAADAIDPRVIVLDTKGRRSARARSLGLTMPSSCWKTTTSS